MTKPILLDHVPGDKVEPLETTEDKAVAVGSKLVVTASFDDHGSEFDLEMPEAVTVNQLIALGSWITAIAHQKQMEALMPRPVPLNREQKRGLVRASATDMRNLRKDS